MIATPARRVWAGWLYLAISLSPLARAPATRFLLPSSVSTDCTSLLAKPNTLRKMVCGQRCSLCSRFFLFLFLFGGIALSILTIWSCSFLDSGVLGSRQSGVGLYRYVDDAGTCIVYPDDFSFTMSDQTARVCGLIAPIIAAGAGLLGMIQLFCCNICCDRCFISCFFTCAQIAQALTFFMFNGSFCTVGLGCSLSFGSYYSMGAWGSYFVASVILCFSPKPDPLCCKKEDDGGEMQQEYTSPVIEPDEDGYHKAVVE